MEYLKIANWKLWQSYRSDRGQPPWIKIWRQLLRNFEWIKLNDAERGQLVSLWMIAADKKGKIPDDEEYLKKLCSMSEKPDLDLFIGLDFIEKRRHRDAKSNADPPPIGRHRDAPEESREDKSRVEKRRSAGARPAPPPFIIIPLKSQELHKIEATQVEELREAYPILDVEQELRSMKQHHQANGLKTAKGIGKAIQFWMRMAIKIREEARRNGHKPGADPQADIGENTWLDTATDEEKERFHETQRKREELIQRELKEKREQMAEKEKA